MKNIKKSTMVPLLCEKKYLNSEIKLKEKVCLLNMKKNKNAIRRKHYEEIR